MVRLQVVFHGQGSDAWARGRLHVTGDKACPPAALPTATARTGRGDAELIDVEAIAGGVRALGTFRGQSCRVRITAWYDSDGDGEVGPGDYVASSAALDVVDEGVFGNNLGVASGVRFDIVELEDDP